MPHKLRKSRKKRGSRTHGYGQIGQHRKGSKGARKAGLDKHGWTYVVKHEPEYFSKQGFTSRKALNTQSNEHTINVEELAELAKRLAEQKKLERKGKMGFVDLDKRGYTKLLGRGRIIEPVIVKIGSYSKRAADKIVEAGGRIAEEET